jgi:hypothetical protein
VPRVGWIAGDYFTILAVAFLSACFHSISGATGDSSSLSQWMAKRSLSDLDGDRRDVEFF